MTRILDLWARLGGGGLHAERVPFRLLHRVCVLALCAVPFARTIDARELSTDRPDRTESPYTVDAGRFQAELDLVGWTRDRADGARINGLRLVTANLKRGLMPSADLQLVIETWNDQRTRFTGLPEERRSGFGDVTARLKLNLWGNDEGATAAALMPFVKLPTNQHQLGNEAVEGGLIVPLALSLRRGWGAGLMAEVDMNRNAADDGHHAEWIATATASHDIGGNLAGFVELFSLHNGEPGATWVGTFDAGLTYAATPDIQVDGGFYAGVSDAAEDLALFLGLTVRR